jgi:hypothetical protein
MILVEISDTETIARSVFAEIAERFPALGMVENSGEPVEIRITIPVQPGLLHEVWLCLQNQDELHFKAGHLWVEWFPCTERKKVEAYLDAVTGFLSGQYRVLEYYRGSICYKAKLQRPEDTGWRKVAMWATIWIPLFRRKILKEIRNVLAHEASSPKSIPTLTSHNDARNAVQSIQ